MLIFVLSSPIGRAVVELSEDFCVGMHREPLDIPAEHPFADGPWVISRDTLQGKSAQSLKRRLESGTSRNRNTRFGTAGGSVLKYIARWGSMKPSCSGPPTRSLQSEAVVRSEQETNPDTLDANCRLGERVKSWTSAGGLALYPLTLHKLLVAKGLVGRVDLNHRPPDPEPVWTGLACMGVRPTAVSRTTIESEFCRCQGRQQRLLPYPNSVARSSYPMKNQVVHCPQNTSGFGTAAARCSGVT